jgi:hypothetical protein
MEQGLKAGVPPAIAEFSIATIYAQKGDKEKTFEHLEKALDAGYNKLEQFDSDAHLTSLRGDPRLAKMRQEVEYKLKPCASTPENRQFDLRLGAWNVEATQGGVPAGQSKIELILGDSAIFGKLAERRKSLCREKLHHLQHSSETLGTILGGRQRRQHIFQRRNERWRDGLLDQRDSAAQRARG